MNGLMQTIKNLEIQMQADRQCLHKNPELSHEEHQTTAFIKQRLVEFGVALEPLTPLPLKIRESVTAVDMIYIRS